MKHIFLTICTIFLTLSAVGQNTRLIKGFVQDKEDGSPLSGATISAIGDTAKAISGEGGEFEMRISPYTTLLLITYEGYISERREVEGSYIVVRMEVDKKYHELKAQAEAEAKAAAEREAIAQTKAKEQARLAAEKEAAAKAKAEEQARIAKAKAEEQARIAAEKEAAAKAKAEEQARIAKAKAEEEARIAAAKKAQREEKVRLAKIAADKRKADIRQQRKGFGSVVDVTYMDKSNELFSTLGLTYTAGYRFNNLVYLGAGTGINYNLDVSPCVRNVGVTYENDFLSPAAVSVPVFAYFKANFINRRVSPYFAMAAGAKLSSKQTLKLDLIDVKYSTHKLFANPQLGLNIRTTTDTSVSLAVGFQYFTAPSCYSFTGYSACLKSVFAYGLDFHLGFTF